MQEQRTPLLEVKLQRPIVIRIVWGCWCAFREEGTAEMDPGNDDCGKLCDGHKRDQKVGLMVVIIRLIGIILRSVIDHIFGTIDKCGKA